jgi:DNA processing protein
MKEDTLFQLALTRTTGIGTVHTKKLIQRFGTAKTVFQTRKEHLAKAQVTDAIANAIHSFCDWAKLEKELLLLEEQGGRMLFYTDEDYPHRLLSIPDFPPVLFYKGRANLNAKRIIAVVGTRGPSEYGKETTQQVIRQLAQPGLLIISGLAFGIDACAHAAAIKNKIPTVGILGHGLGHLYPQENSSLAKAMLAEGGLLTSYGWHTGPEPYRFPERNDIVAGLCDALVVVESGRKGGSLLTVGKAHILGKKIFAVPGRITDTRSAGCNWLISQGKAGSLLSGEQLQAAMGWEWPAGRAATQPCLPFSTAVKDRIEQATAGKDGIETAEDVLLKLLTETKSLSVDELIAKSQLTNSAISIHLLNLELQGLISPLPGRRYRLN